MDTALDGKKIRILIYELRNCSENLPCLYFIHGGGFVFKINGFSKMKNS